MMDTKLLMDGTAKLAEMVGKIGVLDIVKKKLARQPDVAAAKLAAVLEELQKTVMLFEVEVVPLLAMSLSPGPELRRDMATLYSLESQSLWSRSGAARGHCHKIGNIYDRFLDPWFQRVTKLNATERGALKELFDELRDADNVMLDLLNRCTGWIADAALQVLDLLEKNQIDEANELLTRFRKDVLPVRRALAEVMHTLRDLEADFICMSGVN